MERTPFPGLQSTADWYEIGYATGDAAFPLARVRVIPLRPAAAPTQTIPNAPVLPSRIEVRLRASLVDAEGQVLRIAGQLMMGDETPASWQTEAGHPFDPVGWIDANAAAAITLALNVGRTLTLAEQYGLIAAVPMASGLADMPPVELE